MQFFRDLNYLCRKNIWILLPGLLVFLVLIPFSTAGLPGNSIFDIQITHDQMKFRLILDEAVPLAEIAALMMGFLTGITLFGFLLDKKESVIWLSLGITRRMLFAVRYTLGFLMLTLMILPPMLLSVLLNLQAVGPYPGLVSHAVYTGLGLLLLGLLSFSLCQVGIVLAGTFREAMAYYLLFMVGPTLTCMGMDLLCQVLLWGNARGQQFYHSDVTILPGLLSGYAALQPAIFLHDSISQAVSYSRTLTESLPDSLPVGLLLGWALVWLLLLAAGLILLIRRNGEQAGMSGENQFMNGLTSFAAGLAVSAILINLLYDYGHLVSIAMAIAASLMVYLGLYILCFGYRKGERRARYILCGTSGGLVLMQVLLVTMLVTDFAGSTERFLHKEETNPDCTRVEVSYVGNPANFYQAIQGSTNGRGYYITGSLTFTEEEDIKECLRIHSMWQESGALTIGTSQNVDDTVVPYDIRFSYELEDGKKKIWYYDCASYGQLEALLTLGDQNSARENLEAYYECGTGVLSSGSIFFTDSLMADTFEIILEESDRMDLLKAISMDLGNLPEGQGCYSTAPALGVLQFTENGELDCKYFTYHMDNCFLYLNEDYQNTLAWLTRRDLMPEAVEPSEIEEIKLRRFDPFSGMNEMTSPMGMYFMSYLGDSDNEYVVQQDFGRPLLVNDAERIEEILPLLVNGYYMTRGGYMAAVKVKGYEQYRYLFLPEEQAPSFLRE